MREIISFDAAQIGAIVLAVGAATQFIKGIFERLEAWEDAPDWVVKIAQWWAHSKGPVIISFMLTLFVVTLPGIVDDGILSVLELQTLLELFGIGISANAIYWVTRFKKPKWGKG